MNYNALIRIAVQEAITQNIYPSQGPVSHHTGGVPFDTGALMGSITYDVDENGNATITIGDGIEYNEWLNEKSKTRNGWVEIFTQQIAVAIATKLKGDLTAEDDDGLEKELI